LALQPLVLSAAHQDQYLATAGLPANLMEVLALTQIFERRVIHQYARHSRVPHPHPAVKSDPRQIMQDEKWHHRLGQARRSRAWSQSTGKRISLTPGALPKADQEIYQYHAARTWRAARDDTAPTTRKDRVTMTDGQAAG
jgi:hypothetical protein